MMLVTDQMTGSAVRPESALETTLRGSVLVLIQFDVCEEIRLDKSEGDCRHADPGADQLQAPGTGVCALSEASGGRAD